MSNATQTSAIEAIAALRHCDTKSLSRNDRDTAIHLVDRFRDRLTVEQWGSRMGWTIPEFASADWQTMRDAWWESIHC